MPATDPILVKARKEWKRCADAEDEQRKRTARYYAFMVLMYLLARLT